MKLAIVIPAYNEESAINHVLTDIKRVFKNISHDVIVVDDGDVWLDTGTIDSLSDATDFVRVLQKRTGQIIGSPEKIAFEQGFINKEQLNNLADPLKKSGYGLYIA